MKKLRSVKWLLLLLFFTVLWIACGSNKNASNLSESQKEHYREMTQHTINLFHEKKSAEIRQSSTEELKKALTKEKYQEIYSQLETNGSFETFLDYEVSKVQENKQDFIVVAQRVKYSKNTLIYTISFDKDERLAGIFYR